MGIVDQTQGSASRRGLLSRLRRDASGSTILEFAFVAGPFFALIFAILQTAIIFFADQMLDTATQSVSRLILTGVAQSDGSSPMTQTQFKSAACARLPSFMSCNNLFVDVTKVGSDNSAFANASMGRPTITYSGGVASMPQTYTPGSKSDIIMIRLTYPWNVVGAPGLNMASMQNGQFLLMATTIIRTEPY